MKISARLGMMLATLLFGLVLSQNLRAEDKSALVGKWVGKDKAGTESIIDLRADGAAILIEGGKPLPVDPGSSITWSADMTAKPMKLDITVKNGDKPLVLKMIVALEAADKLKLEGGADPSQYPAAFGPDALTFTKK